MNYILLQSSLPPIAITNMGKAKYFDALAIYDETGKTDQLENIIKQCLETELDQFLNIYNE